MTDKKSRALIGVIGGGECGAEVRAMAFEVGRLIALKGFGLVNGGLGGVMEASAEGCRSESGLTVGILPGLDPASANPYMEIIIPTGLGDIRNLLVVRASRALIAIGGSYGTLSEIALGLKAGIPVIGLNTWDIIEESAVKTPEEAVSMAIKAMDKSECKGR